ncbi:MAG: DUF502 domain-containing protein [Halobacteria archaeon]
MDDELKKDLISGIIALAPVVATVYVLYWLYSLIVNLPGLSLLNITGNPVFDNIIKFFFTVGLTLGVLAVFGRLVKGAGGIVVQDRMDSLANSIPGIRLIYNATSMAFETLLGDTGEFQKPIKIEVMDGVRVTGFLTGNKTEDGREIVFVPTSPNVTSGYVLEIESKHIMDTNEGVESALTRVLTAGFGTEETEADLEAGKLGDPENIKDLRSEMGSN